jgi:hypothetical protein
VRPAPQFSASSGRPVSGSSTARSSMSSPSMGRGAPAGHASGGSHH